MPVPELDIYTEPEPSPDTVANLGPLRTMAGIWESRSGEDAHPVLEGTEIDTFVERYELQPIDGQTNGPQLFYGLRYHIHIVKPGETKTFHDQIGYWLWEPAASTVIQTLAIPRAQIAMASGIVDPGATEFELRASIGSESFGICSNPFLLEAFRTTHYRIHVTLNDEDTWSYEEDTIMEVRGRTEPFHHTDHNTLHRVAPPTPNPQARIAES